MESRGGGGSLSMRSNTCITLTCQEFNTPFSLQTSNARVVQGEKAPVVATQLSHHLLSMSSSMLGWKQKIPRLLGYTCIVKTNCLCQNFQKSLSSRNHLFAGYIGYLIEICSRCHFLKVRLHHLQADPSSTSPHCLCRIRTWNQKSCSAWAEACQW